MTCRLLPLSLLLLFLGSSASGQITSAMRDHGLDGDRYGDLKSQVGKLDLSRATDAVRALRDLAADTTLAVRLGESFILERERAGNTTGAETAGRAGADRAAMLQDQAQRTARRLAFERDTGIHCAFDLPREALGMLADQGVVVMPWTRNEMYEWYDRRYPYVTTDLVYHTFMILVRAAIDELENLAFQDELTGLCHRWAQACLDQSATLPAGLQPLARDNAAILAVAAVLAAGGDTAYLDAYGLDTVRRALVEAELARIREAAYLGPSPLLGVIEDYTEYRARGRASGPEGIGYWRARQWLGRVVFPVQDERATRQALLLCQALLSDSALQERWDRLDRITGQLAGTRDDPDVRMYGDLAVRLTGAATDLAAVQVATGDSLLARFLAEAGRWPVPLMDDTPARGRQNVLGLRLLGQRRSADGVLMQRLLEAGPWPPSGVQVLAGLFDLPDEETLLQEMGLELPESAGSVPTDDVGLLAGWRRCHAELFRESCRLPSLYRSAAWRRKQLNTALGAWAETRHAAAPYLKSAHVYAGLTMDKPRLQGYVEPYPEFYARLLAEASRWDDLCREVGIYDLVARQTAGDTEARRLDAERFPAFKVILARLDTLAAKELTGREFIAEDTEFLKSLGTRLRNLCFNHSSMNVAEEPMSRVIDVATEYQSDQILQAGVGLARPIFVVAQHMGESVVCRGAVYGYHEFLLPRPARLDDEAWAGLSAGPVVLGEDPWLARHSGLYFRPPMDRQAFAGWLDDPPGRFSRGRHYPWSDLHDDYRPAPPWQGRRWTADDAPFLVQAAGREDLREDLHHHLLAELSRFGAQPEVAAYWRGVLDRWQDSVPGQVTGLGPAHLFYGLQFLVRHGGPQDRERLDTVADHLDGLVRQPGFRSDVGPVFRWLVTAARTQVDPGPRKPNP